MPADLQHQVVEDRARVAAVAVGEQSVCAIAAGGRLWCWGRNQAGQIGNGQGGTGVIQRRAAGVLGLPPPDVDPIVDVAIGAEHACALTRGGALFCWGGNALGQLGDGTTTPRLQAVPVVSW